MREPGRFLELAKTVAIVISLNEQMLEQCAKQGLLICRRFTAREDLNREFPNSIPGTPYHLFSTTDKKIETVVVTADLAHDQDQLLREIALGMMDNPLYR
jgi:hypothetical protein